MTTSIFIMKLKHLITYTNSCSNVFILIMRWAHTDISTKWESRMFLLYIELMLLCHNIRFSACFFALLKERVSWIYGHHYQENNFLIILMEKVRSALNWLDWLTSYCSDKCHKWLMHCPKASLLPWPGELHFQQHYEV